VIIGHKSAEDCCQGLADEAALDETQGGALGLNLSGGHWAQ
jgi:hypothetical protein